MKQLSFKKHGGKRTGAGRKNLAGEGFHERRPQLQARHPLHITIRLRDGLPNLRQRKVFTQIKRFIAAASEFGLRVNEFAVLRNHIHLIAEVDSTRALQSGMKSFNGRLARFLRRLEKIPKRSYPRGLFQGRYHLSVIKSSRQMRNTLKYVLLNAAQHMKRVTHIDRFSSGQNFPYWRELLLEHFEGLIRAQVLDLEERMGGRLSRFKEISPPRTWLALHGWKRGSF